jgi:hypothetical protein
MKTMNNYLYRFGYKAQLLCGSVVTVFASAFSFFTAYAAAPAAQGIVVSSVSDINSKVLCPVFNALFWILMVVSMLMVLWAAFKYMKAMGDAEDVLIATKTITYAAVGIIVALCAKALPIVVGSIFGITSLTSC